MVNSVQPITVAIPTYRREAVLLDTLGYLSALVPPPAEILVLDQTDRCKFETERWLGAFNASGTINWVRLKEPSIPKAMNHGLRAATHEVVLFVDDDVRPEPDLLAAHVAAHELHQDVLVAGRVIQPWEEGKAIEDDGDFQFAGLRPAWIRQFMGGNFSLRRDMALALGGFDENFVKVAYRFEAEFAHRWLKAGHRIYFEPRACLHHLKVTDGGTRTYGEHLTTWRPDHAVGAYYYALRTGTMREFFGRPWRAVMTRHHLNRPWSIPRTLFAEAWGMLWAIGLFLRGPQYSKG